MRRLALAPLHRAGAGFTLVEIAVVLGVLGLLGVTMTAAFASLGQARERDRALAGAEAARQSLRAFAMRHKRLPCPDNSTNGDNGREAGGGTCPGGLQSGWLPYLSLDLPQPARGQRMRYGVHRGSGDADLVAPPATPACATADTDLGGNAGFLCGLMAAGGAMPSTAHPHHGSDAATPGNANCGATASSNPAFVLVAPLRDADGEAGPAPGFDGMNRDFGAGTSLCTAPPNRPPDARYDDAVATESAVALLGWLARHSR